MEKQEITQKLVLKTTQICVVATQILQQKSNFEYKNYKNVGKKGEY
jgi:hypothetical protein